MTLVKKERYYMQTKEVEKLTIKLILLKKNRDSSRFEATNKKKVYI